MYFKRPSFNHNQAHGGQMLPDWWPDAEDGLYGDEDAFIELLTTGKMALWWDYQVRWNALSDDQKIRCWLMGQTNRGGIPGCTFPGE